MTTGGASRREVRLRFRMPDQVQVASATVDKLCEGLDLDPESRALVRQRTEEALREWIAAVSEPCLSTGTTEPVELVIDVKDDQLRLELHGGLPADTMPFRLLLPIQPL